MVAPAGLVGWLGRWSSRTLVFAAGVLGGLVLIPMVAGAVLLLVFAVRLALPDRPFTPLASPGASISAAGGRQATWSASDHLTRQTCRGACDDLTFASGTPERVEVLDADGRRIVGGSPQLLARVRAFFNGPAAVQVQLDQLKGNDR